MSTYVFLSTWVFLSNLRKELELFIPELSRQLLEVTMSLLSQQTPPPPDLQATVAFPLLQTTPPLWCQSIKVALHPLFCVPLPLLEPLGSLPTYMACM